MAEALTVKNKRDGLIQIVRVAATYTVSVEPGDFTYTAGQHSVWRGLDRGTHVTPRKLDDQTTTAAFSVWLRDLASTAHATLPDICEEASRTSWWGTNTVTTLANSDLLCSDLVFTMDGSAVGETDTTLTFTDMYFTGSMAEGDANTYSVTAEASITGPTTS